MTPEERKSFISERKNLEQKVKSDPFIDPRDMRRIDEIWSLLLTDGANTTTRLAPGKIKKSQRVTSFTRDRR